MTNVETVQLGVHFDPACNWTLGATGLWAQTEQGRRRRASTTSYGTELDIWAEYRYSPLITIGAGVGGRRAGRLGRDPLGHDDNTQFVGYLQARLVF